MLGAKYPIHSLLPIQRYLFISNTIWRDTKLFRTSRIHSKLIGVHELNPPLQFLQAVSLIPYKQSFGPATQ
ncbi:unnamed protein product [Callosobruchus maculatus]|uniref:Uncharacterized protein n=1 Tax=Callosobruchus maculatus TaxID=64391 RepID=A0A653C0G8_CALMS|nr:unnamed protein product [Callosobruchus maculatus]